MKETSKAVKASDERRGLSSTSFKFTAAEREEIRDWAAEVGMSQAAAILDAIRTAKKQGKLSKAQLLAEIERRLK